MTSRRPQHGDVPYDRELIRSGGVTESARRPRPRPSPVDAWPEPNRPRRPRRSSSRIFGRLVAITLLAVLVVVLLVGVRAAAFNASVSTAAFPTTALLGALNGDGRVNVLMIGYGGGGHGGAYLADSIQVLSIDAATDTTTTIPIPRDLWIEGTASFGRSVKINEVFSAGQAAGGLDEAGALLAEVVSEVTGLDVEHWLSIDFAGFQEMVDAVGGVTVENPVTFSYTMTEEQHRAGDWSDGTFPSGQVELDGAEALAYTRARYTSVVSEASDFARSVRQARVLSGLREKLGDGGVTSVLPGFGLMGAMEGHVRTDLSAFDLFLLSSHLDSDRRIELTEGPVLTATTNTNGAYILVPTDWIGPGSYGGLRSYLARELATDAS